MLSESFKPFFEWCGKTWLGTVVRDNVLAFPVIETFHLLALAILLGSVLIVNLRVFGLGANRDSHAADLEPWMLVSVAVLIVTGIPMAMSEPMKCFESISFPIKMILIVVAITWHFAARRRWAESKVAATISILLWASIGAAGKGIPYV